MSWGLIAMLAGEAALVSNAEHTRDLKALYALLEAQQSPVALRANTPPVPGVYQTDRVEKNSTPCVMRLTSTIPAFKVGDAVNPAPISKTYVLEWAKVEWLTAEPLGARFGPGGQGWQRRGLYMNDAAQGAKLAPLVSRIAARCSGQKPLSAEEHLARRKAALAAIPPARMAEVYPAGLNWAFTRWRMSPAEVVAASRGALSIEKPDASTNSPGGDAVGIHTFLGLPFQARLRFYGNRSLRDVTLRSENDAHCQEVQKYYARGPGGFVAEFPERNLEVTFTRIQRSCELFHKPIRL